VRGFDAGKNLVLDARIQAVGFTGSLKAGRALFDLAVSRPEPIPFYGELGSVNPVFVSANAAARETLPSEYLDSLLLGVGQFCTNPGVIVVPADSDIVERTATEISARSGGHMLNKSVRDLFDSHVAELTSKPGVKVVAAGEPNSVGFYAAPTLATTKAADALKDPSILTVECFGPAGLVVTYDNDDEALALAQAFPGSLVASLHADEYEPLAVSLLPLLAGFAGRVVWNGWPTGVAVTRAQQHGGPYPAATFAATTSVGATAIGRFLRPVAFQSVPQTLLPQELRD
jgi:NADP-dependent aldehyde dehydrogenase